MFPVASRVLGLSVVIGTLGVTFFAWLYPTVPITDVLTIISLISIFLAFIVDFVWRVLYRKTKN